MLFFLLIIIGLITGILAGLLGIGGGVITVPAMYYLFQYYDFPLDHLMHTCIATSLASTMLTSLGSTWSHHRKSSILYTALKMIVPGLVIGCVSGAAVSYFLSSNTLKAIFGIMAIVFAIYFFFPKLPQIKIANAPNQSLGLFGFVVGNLSSLLGVGGGIFMVPILLGYQMSLQSSVATSSASTLATALTGTLSYLVIAQGQVSGPDSFGYIQIPAFLTIGICSLATTSWGSKLAHTLPPTLIKKVFACALAATGVAMILGS